ncbi:hypothetical protein JOB18_028758 [Solea senegalensis]|uniref:Secreted protein n=1 Tax=Solea senegalensis TaxID=28829 RepID=A0AAV6QQ60_SOLSE|nr:hypothetical protein JOB18_028758 [Solea senegalensis]
MRLSERSSAVFAPPLLRCVLSLRGGSGSGSSASSSSSAWIRVTSALHLPEKRGRRRNDRHSERVRQARESNSHSTDEQRGVSGILKDSA